jgi:hypothetical protein
MTATLPSADPIFALAPGLRVHVDPTDGRMVANSRDVASYFGWRNHRAVLRRIAEEIWDTPWRPDCRTWARALPDGSFDLESEGLIMLTSGRYSHGRRARAFIRAWIAYFCNVVVPDREAKTGRPFIREMLGVLAGKAGEHVRHGFINEHGEFERVCYDCHAPEAGPMLHDQLWLTIAEPEALLCFECIEARLKRPLTQADLTPCPFNAGWLAFDAVDPAAHAFARGRHLLPEGPT